MTDVAISVEHVSKRFKLYHNLITGPIKEHLFFWKGHQYYQEFMAVRDVSLEVKRGEVVGIIGPNGAGKSTLLKMVAGLLPVETGRIRVDGKITALLALGVGVHYEFTGRENIFYGGMLMGMSKREVLGKMDAFVEFAELGEFIEQPFRTYSSGMKARLLFAISMSIDPDILIVDEALATGDTYFVNKCMERIREICRGGATILFVSHNLYQIQQLCNRALFLAEGRVMAEGSTAEAIIAYNRWAFNKGRESVSAIKNSDLVLMSGTGDVILTDLRMLGQDGRPDAAFHTGQEVHIEMHYRRNNHSIRSVHLFVGIVEAKTGRWVGEICTARQNETDAKRREKTAIHIENEGVIRVTMSPMLALNNLYGLWVILGDGTYHSYCEYWDVCQYLVARETNATVIADAIYSQPFKITTRSLEDAYQ